MDEIEQNYLSEKDKKVEEKPKKDEAGGTPPVKPPPKPYPVFGTDFTIYEGDFIEFYKARMKIMAIKFKLVGQVNSQGTYVINEDIRRDLVRMEKEIEDSGETFYKAIALYMRKYFYFHIKIEEKENGMAKATLYLSEFVDGFLGQDYIVTPVAEYNSINDDEFRIRVRKAFHLVDVEVKNDDTAVPDLAVIMQDALDMELLLGGFFDMASQVYLMKMLKALEESKNPTCKKVLDRYHQLLALQNLDINDKFKYIKFKSLLDNAIDEVGGMEKLGLGMDILKPIIADFNKIAQVITSARKGILEMDTPVKPEELLKQNKQTQSTPKKMAGNPPKQPPPPAKKPQSKAPPKVEAKEEPKEPISWPEYLLKDNLNIPLGKGRLQRTSVPPAREDNKNINDKPQSLQEKNTPRETVPKQDNLNGGNQNLNDGKEEENESDDFDYKFEDINEVSQEGETPRDGDIEDLFIGDEEENEEFFDLEDGGREILPTENESEDS